MILFINTSQTDLIQLKLIKDDKITGQLESRENFKQSELLLLLIDQIFKNAKLKISACTAVAAVSGPGAFSALRLGVATANALALALKIPLAEVTAVEAEDNGKLAEVLRGKIVNHQLPVIIPKYGREPNITKSRIVPARHDNESGG